MYVANEEIVRTLVYNCGYVNAMYELAFITGKWMVLPDLANPDLGFPFQPKYETL